MSDMDIAKAWPDRWAKANGSRPGASKRRNNLRKQWKHHLAFVQFKAANPSAVCANCTNFAEKLGRTICLADSDFYGDALTKPLNVCVLWSKAEL